MVKAGLILLCSNGPGSHGQLPLSCSLPWKHARPLQQHTLSPSLQVKAGLILLCWPWQATAHTLFHKATTHPPNPQVKAGLILLCSTKPLSDMEILTHQEEAMLNPYALQ